jgi:hypothetical protein
VSASPRWWRTLRGRRRYPRTNARPAISGPLARARLEIAGIVDQPTREALLAQWREADVSLRAAASGFQAFNERRVEDQISGARIQTTRLADALGRGRVR